MIITKTKAQRGRLTTTNKDANGTASANQMHYYGAQKRKNNGNPFEKWERKENKWDFSLIDLP
jgi:hypothetical protein